MDRSPLPISKSSKNGKQCVFACHLNAALNCAFSSLRPVRLHGRVWKILMPVENVLFWYMKFWHFIYENSVYSLY